ncbi:hypothetical protein JVU11DRAFT_8283 [Chiua virens]|nr:hypothetical protein JVU11DRAFT_8283 [Chiua virens]
MSSTSIAAALPPGVEAIPEEKLDLRPESEIVGTLLTYRPVTSEKNIWAFWNTGWDNMRPVDSAERHCVDAPFRAIGLDATADFLRIALLYEHGGVWLDVSCMIFCDLDDIWSVIQDPKTEYTMCAYIIKVPPKEFYLFSNAALFSQKGDAFMKRWRDVFAALWKGRTGPRDLSQDLLISWLEPYTPMLPGHDPSDEINKSILNDYIAVNLAAERLFLIQDPVGRLRRTFILFTTNLDGQKLFDLFASQREGIEPGERNQEAETIANYMYTNTTIAKFFSGFGATNRDDWLPCLWNRPEHANADIKEGSFIAWLRYAQVHLRPTRKVVPMMTEAIPIENIVKMGACERIEVKLVPRQKQHSS